MEHELSRGALSVDSRGKYAHLRDPPAPAAASPVALDINPFRALDVGVQGKRESWWWPLALGPRHFLMSALTPMAES